MTYSENGYGIILRLTTQRKVINIKCIIKTIISMVIIIHIFVNLNKVSIYAQNNDQLINDPQTPSTGNVYGVCILVDFPDCSHNEESTSEYYQRIFDEKVHPFFADSSFGKLDFQVDVMDEWYTAKYSRSYYEELTGEHSRAYVRSLLLQEAIQALDETVDFSVYDGNNDSYIDEVYLLCAGSEGVWGTFWYPNANTAEIGLVADQVVVRKFAHLSENYFSSALDGAIIHETAHGMGLPDLYTTSGTNMVSVSDIMSNDSGDFNAYSKTILGWISPQEVSEPCTITLRPSAIYPDAAFIYPNCNTESSSFFVIEYVTSDTPDIITNARAPYGGLRIWRVNENGRNGTLDSIPLIHNVDWMNSEGQVLYDLGQDYHSAFWFGDKDFTPYSYPSSGLYFGTIADGLTFSGITIKDIVPNGKSLSCKIEYEEKPSNTDFIYSFDYEIGDRLFGILTFPVETYITGNDSIMLYTNDHKAIDVEYYMDSMYRHDSFTHLVIKADLSQDKDNIYHLEIPANTLKNAYGVNNPLIELEITDDGATDSTSTGLNEKTIGASNVVMFDNSFYCFREVDGFLNKQSLNYDFEVLESVPLFKVAITGSHIKAISYKNESIILSIMDSFDNYSIYKVYTDNTFEKIGNTGPLGTDLTIVSNQLIIFELLDYEMDLYNICLLDLETGDRKLLISDFYAVSDEFKVAGDLIVIEHYWDSDDYEYRFFNFAGDLIRTVNGNNFVDKNPREVIASPYYSNDQRGIISYITTSTETKIINNILDYDGTLISKEIIYQTHGNSGVSGVYSTNNGYVIAIQTETERMNDVYGYVQFAATALFFDLDFNFMFSKIFDKPLKGDMITSVYSLENGDFILTTQFEIMSVHQDSGRQSIKDLELLFDIPSVGYPISPEVNLSNLGILLTEGEDFLVSNYNNTSPGFASTRIIGIGDYCGQIDVTYSSDIIYDWNIEDQNVTANAVCKYQNKEINILSETVSSESCIVKSPSFSDSGEYCLISEDFDNSIFKSQTINLELPTLSSIDVLQLPDNLEVIESEAFYGLSCQAVILPSTCKYVFEGAFEDCNNLKYVRLSRDTNVADNAFNYKIIFDYYDAN